MVGGKSGPLGESQLVVGRLALWRDRSWRGLGGGGGRGGIEGRAGLLGLIRKSQPGPFPLSCPLVTDLAHNARLLYRPQSPSIGPPPISVSYISL